MTLATKDCVTFYASPDLIHWRKESVFGKLEGAHGGVWECPDLFPLQFNGEEYWILTVNMNPGGPNMGSGIQYFIGKFDGHQFQPLHQDIRWLDYGPDNYAGVTFSNTGSRIIQMGWMSNWDYAEKLPTKTWRNSMTIPRELQLKKIGSELRVCSFPIAELKLQRSNKFINSGSLQSFQNINKTKTIYPSLIQIDISNDEEFHFAISNKKGEETVVGFDAHQQQFYVDRTKSGVIDFHPHFQGRKKAPRLSASKNIQLSILIDAGSVEVFADQGATVLTALNFPTTPYDQIKIHSKKPLIKGHFEWIQYK
jgi:fructan beta-fructosidase